MNLDIVIFIGFLTINLVSGLLYGRNVKNLREFAIGDRNFSTITIAATLVATWISGGSFSLYMAETYSQGLYFITSIFADACSFLIIGYLLAPRMAEFLGQLSVAEAMGSMYGKHVRVITALSGVIGTIGALALQFKVSSTILSYLFGISGIYAALASGTVVILYSTFGGVKSVTFTDLIQFFTFTGIIPIIIFALWSTMDEPNVYNIISQHPLFDYQEVFNFSNPKFWTFFTIFLYFLIPGLSPATFQRITMARNITQVQNSFALAAVILLLVELLIAWIAILIFVKNPGLDSGQLVNYIIDNYATVGIKGLIITGIIAMIMSTADSYINSASILFTHDLCDPLGWNIKDSNSLFLSRIFSVLIGIIALGFTFYSSNLLNLFLLGYSFYMIVVTVPFIMAILGFRSTTKATLIGMTAGIIVVIIWNWLGKEEIDSVIPGMIANFIGLMAAHYLLKQPEDG